MKVTKSQMISLAVLGVAVGAFILDRYFGESTAPHPQLPTLEHGAAVPVAFSTPAVPSPIVSSSDLVDRLAALKAGQNENSLLRDAFAVPAGFGARIDEDQISINARTARFQAEHRLKAIIHSDGNSQAVVDTSLIKVGQSLDGFQLRSVHQLRAVFVDGDIKTELRIEQPDGTTH
jgi:hypothetical protein